MISADEFEDNLLEFRDVLLDIDGPPELQILQCKVDTIANCSYIKMQFQLNQCVLAVIISYHQLYQVPVLYFQVFTKEGEFDQLVQHHDIDAFDLSPKQLILDNHPSIPGVFFSLHPCETRDTIEQFMDNIDNPTPLSYLVCWNGIYGIGMFRGLSVRFKEKT